MGEYTGSLRDFFHEAARRVQCQIFSTTDGGAENVPTSRHFYHGTPLHQVLTDPNCLVNCPRIAVLFLLHAIYWDHRQNSRSVVDHYFKNIHLRIMEEGLNGGSVDHLLWSLITAPSTHQIDGLERSFLLARLLRIHARLSGHLQVQVEEALLNLLAIKEWDWGAGFELELLRSEILDDLGFGN